MQAYLANPSLGSASEMADVCPCHVLRPRYTPSSNRSPPTQKYLDAQHELAFFTNSECILQAEVDTVVAALGGDEGAQKPHQFKSSSFTIPTECGYCKVRSTPGAAYLNEAQAYGRARCE
jgi:hypothetical protein